jgi:ferrous iron transport protein B
MAETTRKNTTRELTVAICGNPNCGKTTIFNAITGLRQKVGNYPGVTVDKVSGQFRVPSDPTTEFTITDIPGSYSLAAFSPDEAIAARALTGSLEGEPTPDVIVCVIDATNLERGLYLLFQVLQVGRPAVVALNMVDLARKKGLEIDTDQLSQLLGGLPVVEVVGSRRIGIDKLKQAILSAAGHHSHSRHSFYASEIEDAVDTIITATNNGHRSRAEYIRVLFDVGGPAEQSFMGDLGRRHLPELDRARARLAEKFGSLSAAETNTLTNRAGEIAGQVVTTAAERRRTFSDHIDKVALHPIIGPILLVFLMTLMFQSIFSWAEPIMHLVDTVFGSLAGLVEGAMPAGPLRSLLTDGIIGGVGSVIVFLPQIVILFLFIAFLEDSGYMPRAAFLVDRAFGWCGLSGKSFIPMLSSFACAVPGIMATRTIEDRKLRIATIMVAPLMTCSARLPVYAIMIAAFIPHKTYFGIFNLQGLVLTSLYLLGIVVAVIVSFIFKKFVFKTERASFLMEMPSYKLPTPGSIAVRVYNRARSFLVRAGTVIAAITIIVWALSYYPRSEAVEKSFDTQREEITNSFTSEADGIDARVDQLVSSAPSVTRDWVTNTAQALAPSKTEDELIALTAKVEATTPAQRQALMLISRKEELENDYGRSLQRIETEESGAHLRNSYFARAGKAVEPVFRHLGWDWKITMAALASFPAREVIIATLGTIYNLGGEVDEASSSLVTKMRRANWEDGPRAGERVFTPAVALSVMVFFALCCQCGATVVTIRQEAGRWIYAIVTFVYMTTLAFIGALITYNLFTWIGF